METPLYIALCKTEEAGRYHWALVAAENIAERVTAYQIRKGSSRGLGWMIGHSVNIGLDESKSFLCCIRLPPVTQTKQALDVFIERIPAVPDNRRELQTHESWTCAQWVIEVIRRLTEWNHLQPNIGRHGWDAVYTRIKMLALHFEKTRKAQMIGRIPVLQYPFLA